MKYAFFPLALTLLACAYSCKEKPNEVVPPKSDPEPTLVYDTTSHNITWFADTLGDYGQELNDIWAADSVNFYAVGSINISSDPNRIPRSIIKWNGTDWIDLPEVGYGQSQQLSNTGKSIFGFSNTDIWIAGVSRANGTVSLQGEGYPFSHFNGTNWTTVTAPTPPWDIFGIRVNIYDMWGSDPNHLWAVGDSGLVYFWNGSNWRKQAVPQIVVDKGFHLQRVRGVSHNEVYVTGTSLFDGTILLKFDGVKWDIIYLSPHFVSNQPFFLGNTIYGEWQMGNKIEKKLWLFADNLYEWDRQASPSQMTWSIINGFNLQAFGSGIDATKGSNIFSTSKRQIAHWNGVSWKKFVDVAPNLQGNIHFLRIAVKGKTLAGVGRNFDSFSRPYVLIGKQE